VIDWQPIVASYFDKEDVVKALTIIYCESSGRSSAQNINTNKTSDIGLWQFNDKTWSWLKDKLGVKSNRNNPDGIYTCGFLASL